jgi:DNA-binding NarL/FixJ family response regulator
MSVQNDYIGIAVVDDHPIVLEGLQKILAQEPQVRIAGQFTKGQDFLAHLKSSTDVDIVLLDINLPDGNGIALCHEIKMMAPDTIVLALSNHSERSIIMQMLQSGASGYLLKNASAAELLSCIHEALEGQLAFSKEVKTIIAKPAAGELRPRPLLTKREKEILRLIADGNTSTAIAGQLFLSPLTVETHRRNLMQKFEVKNVAMLIKAATQQQMI